MGCCRSADWCTKPATCITLQSRCSSPSVLSPHSYQRPEKFVSQDILSSRPTSVRTMRRSSGRRFPVTWEPRSVVPHTDRETQRSSRHTSQTYDRSVKLPTVARMLPLNWLPPKCKDLQIHIERESNQAHSGDCCLVVPWTLSV